MLQIKESVAVMPKVITAEFFRRGRCDRLRYVAIAPGCVGTPVVSNMDQRALAKILDQVPIGRLVAPEEVASLVGELSRNEALNGETIFDSRRPAVGFKGLMAP